MPYRTPCGETQYRLSRVSAVTTPEVGGDEIGGAGHHQGLVGLHRVGVAVVADQADDVRIHAIGRRQAAAAEERDRRLRSVVCFFQLDAGDRIRLGVNEIQFSGGIEVDVENVETSGMSTSLSGRDQLRCRRSLTVGGAQEIGDEPGDLLDTVGQQHVKAADRAVGIGVSSTLPTTRVRQPPRWGARLRNDRHDKRFRRRHGVEERVGDLDRTGHTRVEPEVESDRSVGRDRSGTAGRSRSRRSRPCGWPGWPASGPSASARPADDQLAGDGGHHRSGSPLPRAAAVSHTDHADTGLAATVRCRASPGCRSSARSGTWRSRLP